MTRIKFVVDPDAQFEECNGEARPLTEDEYRENPYRGCPMHPRSKVPPARVESCSAVATVSYVSSPDGSRRLEYLSSGGLYGIDNPSEAYRREIEDEELVDLQNHLLVFGVDVRNFAQIAGRPELQP